ncbi:MAG TPA: hypothetical protein VFM15_10660, partial [Gammaproteobacteria bacterium]|nr:hypothetical protein [Gammaproteobacteria bacterium]
MKQYLNIRNWSIRARLLLLALLPLLIFGGTLSIYVAHVRVQDLQRSRQNLGQSLSSQLAIASEYGVFSGNRKLLQDLINSAMREPDIESIVITGKQGTVLASASRPSSKSPLRVTDIALGDAVSV